MRKINKKSHRSIYKKIKINLIKNQFKNVYLQETLNVLCIKK